MTILNAELFLHIFSDNISAMSDVIQFNLFQIISIKNRK